MEFRIGVFPFRMCADGNLWNPEKVKSRSGRVQMESCGILRSHNFRSGQLLECSGILWNPLESSGILWNPGFAEGTQHQEHKTTPLTSLHEES